MLSRLSQTPLRILTCLFVFLLLTGATTATFGQSQRGSADAVPTDTGATVNVREAGIGATLSVDVPNVADDVAAVTGLTMTMQFAESNFRVEFTKPQPQPPSGTPAVDDAVEGASAVRYFTASAINVQDSSFESVKFTFTVSQSALPEGTSPSDVRLFRYHDGQWQTLETEHLGGDRYRATSPGFTVYAIGTQQQQQDGTPTTTTPGPTTSPPSGTAGPGTSSGAGTPVQEGGTGSPFIKFGMGFGVMLVISITILTVRAIYRRIQS